MLETVPSDDQNSILQERGMFWKKIKYLYAYKFTSLVRIPCSCVQIFFNLTKVHPEPKSIIKQGASAIHIDLFNEKNIYALQNIALFRMEIIFAKSVFSV